MQNCRQTNPLYLELYHRNTVTQKHLQYQFSVSVSHAFSPCIGARVVERTQQSHRLPEATPIQPRGEGDYVQGNSFGLEASSLSWVGRKESCPVGP